MKMLIGDQWVDKKEKIEVRNPYNNDLVDTVPSGDKEDVDAALGAAEDGFRINRGLPVHERISILYRAAQIIKDRQEEFARTIATEGSKTIREARKEASPSTAGRGRKTGWDIIIASPSGSSPPLRLSMTPSTWSRTRSGPPSPGGTQLCSSRPPSLLFPPSSSERR
jgi:hypothetical protein